jgi:acid phosphatase
MLLTRRQFTAGTATLTAGASLPAQAATAALPILLVGDWGREGQDGQSAVAVQMGKTAAAMRVPYIVSVGDNFYEDGVAGLNDPQWQTSFEQIYTAPALQVPWKIILGNHDYRGNVQAQLDYSQKSRRWRLPARYYAESQTLPDGARADFFYLDTSPFIKKYLGSKVNIAGQDTDTQLAWLDKSLAGSTAKWKIVIGHHPIYTALNDYEGEDHDLPDLIARVNPVLQKHGIRIYICGHDHLLQSAKMDGITYVVTGAGSQTYTPQASVRNGAFVSSAHGFMTMRLSGTALDYALVDSDGTTLFGETIARA